MLVSPGLEITVTDESQYVSTAVGTVPFVLLATAENKVYNGSVATYTTKSYAGQLLAVTSQRELMTNFGYPTFQTSAAGTPSHGNELNEYGLMAAYSALGVSNRMYVIRADIDLAQLEGTAVRPIGSPTDGTYWLDLTNTAFGIYEWNAVTQAFTNKVPMVITNPSSVTAIGGILTPNASVGQVGSYAVVASSPNNYVFFKRSDNIWVQVGNTEWQNAFPALVGTVSEPTFTPNAQMTINTITVTITGSSADIAASNINSANIPGVTASVNTNRNLQLFVTAEAMSNGSNADGKMAISDGTHNPAAAAGLSIATAKASPALEFGTYVQIPDWRSTDTTPRPSGSVWVKTSVLGSGANLVLKAFDAANDSWIPISTPIYDGDTEAIYKLDPGAGGLGIQAGTVYVQKDALRNGTVTFRPFIRQTQGVMSITGTIPSSLPMSFAPGDAFDLTATMTLSGVATTYPVVLASGTNPDPNQNPLVEAILAAAIPDVTAQVEATGAVTIIHKTGGTITLANTTNHPLTAAGFTSATIGLRQVPGTTELQASNFAPLIYTYSLSQPYTAPQDGTLWYYNSPLEVDIMVNETTGWKGYRNVSRDARGFNLVNTDPNGPIMTPIQPTTKSNNQALSAGDLWIDTGDLENFPVISRYTGSKWVKVDNTDVITQNGIVFADARWDGWIDPVSGNTATSQVDPAAGDMPAIADLLTSNFVDLDCPDHRLSPRGTLLFNMRRSGFNVKHYVSNYFNEHSYPTLQDYPTSNRPVTSTWVTSSGLQNDGAMFAGHKAQRQMVVKAMRGALDSSDTVREESFGFNLIAAPGYPELISNMVELNNDRKNTAFIIGDTPMTLPAKIMDVTNWSTDADGTGLATADPYLGVYYPSGLSNDLQGNTIVVPPSHIVLRAAIKSDSVSYPWFAFAGTRRGLVDNATDIGYVDSSSGAFVRNGINQGMRDALYQLNVNPITILPSVGLTIFGNKTRNGFASAMDRVNVARLVNYIRTILAHVGDGFLFEPNDAITRNQIKNVISSAINTLIAKRGIYDYVVVCDDTNNTNDRIARNELYVDIAIEPMKDVEFIYIPIRLLNPGGIKALGAA